MELILFTESSNKAGSLLLCPTRHYSVILHWQKLRKKITLKHSEKEAAEKINTFEGLPKGRLKLNWWDQNLYKDCRDTVLLIKKKNQKTQKLKFEGKYYLKKNIQLFLPLSLILSQPVFKVIHDQLQMIYPGFKLSFLTPYLQKIIYFLFKMKAFSLCWFGFGFFCNAIFCSVVRNTGKKCMWLEETPTKHYAKGMWPLPGGHHPEMCIHKLFYTLFCEPWLVLSSKV